MADAGIVPGGRSMPAPASMTMSASTLAGVQPAGAGMRRAVPAARGPGAAPQFQPLAAPAARGPGRSAAAAPSKDKRRAARSRDWRAALPLAKAVVGASLLRALVVRVLAPAAAHARPLHRLGGLLSLVPRRLGGAGPAQPPSGPPGARKPALLWFRNDLRLHDHAPLAAANRGATALLPVYCFDPREYGQAPGGFDKTGPHRARFLVEAVAELRARLRDAGSDLLVRVGRPEDVLPALATAAGAGSVHCHREVTPEEAGVERAVAAALDRTGTRLVRHWGNTLLDMGDLPFAVEAMPRSYGDFRARVASLSVRPPVEQPAHLRGLPLGSPEPGDIPSLRRLGFSAATLARCAADKSAQAASARGGEGEGLRQLQACATRMAAQQRGQRQQQHAGVRPAAGAGGGGFSCKVSPWLAMGCLSPRQMYQRLKEQAGAAPGSGTQQQGAAAGRQQDGMSWLTFELLWRDFFRFINASYTESGAKVAAPAAMA